MLKLLRALASEDRDPEDRSQLLNFLIRVQTTFDAKKDGPLKSKNAPRMPDPGRQLRGGRLRADGLRHEDKGPPRRAPAIFLYAAAHGDVAGGRRHGCVGRT